MSRIATHYFPVPSENGRWWPLTVVVRDEEGKYFIGVMSDVSVAKEEIDHRVASNELRTLPREIPFEEDRRLWLYGDGDDTAVVWHANRKDPADDSGKVEVEKIDLTVS